MDRKDRRTAKRRKGDWGEEKACDFLKEKGYRICERNFSCRTGELDIVAVKGCVISFVEVKVRKRMDFGLPCQAVDNAKQRRLKKTAEYFMLTHKWYKGLQMSMDIIEILTLDSGSYIRHLENAF